MFKPRSATPWITAAAVLVLFGIAVGVALGGSTHNAPIPVVVHQVDQTASTVSDSSDSATAFPVEPTDTVTVTSSSAEVVSSVPASSAVVGHYNTANPGSVDTGPRPAPAPVLTPCQTPSDFAQGVTLTDPCPQQ
jgi:hypothetical protein